jgi:predicted small lipoprotein YifL
LKLFNSVCGIAMIALLLGSISACGQRGPLYLPKPDAPAAPNKTTQSPAASSTSSTPSGDAAPTPVTK